MGLSSLKRGIYNSNIDAKYISINQHRKALHCPVSQYCTNKLMNKLRHYRKILKRLIKLG